MVPRSSTNRQGEIQIRAMFFLRKYGGGGGKENKTHINTLFRIFELLRRSSLNMKATEETEGSTRRTDHDLLL